MSIHIAISQAKSTDKLFVFNKDKSNGEFFIVQMCFKSFSKVLKSHFCVKITKFLKFQLSNFRDKILMI